MHRNSKVVLILSFCLITTAVLAAGRCVPCKLNHYCIDGLRYQCPANTPVTQGMGAGALNECLTCTQRNGNSANPIYDDLVGDCVSCYEYDSSTPIWDGNACVACASGTAFNGETGLCETTCPGEIHSNGVCILTAQLNECESGYIGISTAEELAKIGVDSNYPLSGNYCLLNDISLAAYGENYNNGEGWTPIGSGSNFKGVFDGNGYEISDLYINRPNTTERQGLFQYIAGGEVRNIGILGNITGASQVGFLAGFTTGTKITNAYAIGSISGTDKIGGLIAMVNGGTIAESFTIVNITGTGDMVGGIVGYAYKGGGINIENVYTTGVVSGSSDVGGITGAASGYFLAGPGSCASYMSIIDSYSTASVSGSSNVGGILGVAGADHDCVKVINSYFDITTTGQTVACGLIMSYSICDAVGFTTSEMQTPQTFIDAGWDTTIWSLVQGEYPKLIGVGGQD